MLLCRSPGCALDCIGDSQVKTLTTREREGRRERLPDQRVREFPTRFPTGCRHDEIGLLRFFQIVISFSQEVSDVRRELGRGAALVRGGIQPRAISTTSPTNWLRLIMSGTDLAGGKPGVPQG